MTQPSTSNGHSSRIGQRRGSVIISPSTFPKQDDISLIKLVDHTGSTRVVRQNTESGAEEEAIVCENVSTDFNDIKEVFLMLTDEQRKIVMHIYYLYNRKKTNGDTEDNNGVGRDIPKVILQGPAGTGKSTVINFLEKLVTWEENKKCDDPQKLKVIKCAFTGKAAANIEGFTLNNMLSIPFYKTRSLRKEKLDTKKSLLENCIFFICDEISMVGERLMDSVNLRLKQIFENDELYGGLFVLLVGDLYQIDPVRQKSLYPSSNLWTCCDFYELTKIIRQHDENFTNALNNFRDGKMTEENIILLRSREVQDTALVPDSAIHIFYLNKHVNDYNTEKLNKSNEKEETVNNIVDENLVPTTLRLKIGIRYMITYNMDVGDGLANGITGVVKDFNYDKDNKVNVVWMEFYSDIIGSKARSDYYKNHPGPKPGFEKFVPICQSKILVKLKSDPTARRRVPNMFPLIAAEAITVHKSQGQTFHVGVCIHFTEDSYDKLRTNKSLQYVALTRVTKVEDLYISGKLNYSLVNDKINRVEKELNRLRTERKLKLAYETFNDKTEDVIVFLNTGLTFKDHYQFVSCDKWYDNGSLLIFTETNIIPSNKIEIPNFEYDTATALESGGRVICYKKANKSVEVISSMTDDKSKTHLTLLLYEKYLYVIAGVNGNLNNGMFKSLIQELLLHYVKDKKCIFFISICNMSSNISDVFDILNLRKKIWKTNEILDTNEEKQSDVVLVLMRNCDIQLDDIGFYEYIPSPHKPMYVKLPQNFKLLNYQRPCSSKYVTGVGVAAHSDLQASIVNSDTGREDVVENAVPATHTTEAEVGHNKRPMGSGGDSTLQASTPKRTRVRPHTDTSAAESMFIIPVAYPAIRIQKEHFLAIQRVILLKLYAARDSNKPPIIILGDIVQGALHISCQGKEATTWITSVIGQEEIAGLHFKVVDPNNLPKPVKMVWNTNIICDLDVGVKLSVLQKINTSLRTELWEIVDTVTSDTKTVSTILVDQESADVIKTSGYKLLDGVGYSCFELLEDTGGRMDHPSENVDDVSGSMTDGT